MKILIKNINVITMVNEEIRYGMDILVNGGKIEKIAYDLPAPEEPDAVVIDGKGKYAMPSMFDGHVHVDSSEMCDLFIANGVTGVRNLSGTPRTMELAKEIREGKRIGPYIYSSSPIYNHEPEGRHVPIASEEDVYKAIEDTIENRYLWIKTYPEIDKKYYRLLLKEAGKAGLKLCGHMARQLDAKELCDTGYICCEHISSMPDHSDDVKYIAEHGMWLCPTYKVCTTIMDFVWGDKELCDVPGYRYLPERTKAFWEKDNVRLREYYRGRNLRPDFSMMYRPVRRFMEYSNNVITGTDCMYPSLVAGFSLHSELERMVNFIGMTPFEALCSVTCNTARHIGIQDRKGYLKQGYDSDILILNNNPLSDINNTTSIEAVIQGTFFYDRKALDAILDKVEHYTDDDVEALTDFE